MQKLRKMLTFVSAFLLSDSVNRTFADYLINFEKLARSEISILLFLDEKLKGSPEEIALQKFSNITIPEYITINKGWIPTDPILPSVRNVKKDTINYFAIQLMKLELLAKATSYCQTSHLAWIDFGIFHMIKNVPLAYERLRVLEKISSTNSEKIIAPGCSAYVSTNLWDQICWRFCGSFLFGPRENFQKAYQRQMEIVFSFLPRLTWEINYWAQMEDYFEIYPSNHDDNIININVAKLLKMSSDSEIISFVRPFTSVSEERIQNVLFAIETSHKENISGDLVEIGVWKGGLIMAMALKCKQLGITRTIHAYDTFQGTTLPGDIDVDLAGQKAKDILPEVTYFCSLDEFERNIAMVNYPDIIIHQGDILQTPLSEIPSSIAVLRLDTDWYESTRFELRNFEPKVSDYGFIIVDDYGHWKGSQRAVDEFSPPFLNKIDYTGVYWRKDYGREILKQAVIDHPECEVARVLLENFHHFVGLYHSLNGRFWHGCGSYMFDGQHYCYHRQMLKKQEALFNVGKNASRVLEVGVYLGHSLLILLISNPNLTIDCIDVDASFSPRAVAYLNAHFNNRIRFYLGPAKDILPQLTEKYDCVHIDADHYPDAVTEQFQLSRRLANKDAWVVFDDYEAVKSCIDGWIGEGILEHITTPWCIWTNIVTKLLKPTETTVVASSPGSEQTYDLTESSL